MYDYDQRIYDWLIGTFSTWLSTHDAAVDDILTAVSDIMFCVRNMLYLGIFVFFFWLFYSWVKPHLMRV